MDWREFAKQLVIADGKISPAETARLRRAILADGKITREEVEFLIDLKRSAVAVPPAFDQFLYAVLKRVVLADGAVSDAEAAWLEKTLFADRLLVTDMTVRFLRELARDAAASGPRFKQLVQEWAGVRVTGRPAAAAPRPARRPARPPARPRTAATRS